MTRGRQQIFAGLLCAGLLSGCAGPAGEASPAPGPNVEEHWSVLEETGRLPAVGSRWRDGPMEELTPGPNYGALIPFAGAGYYRVYPGGEDGAVQSPSLSTLYGLMTLDGCVVLDPVCDFISRLSWTDEKGQDQRLPVWELTRGSPEAGDPVGGALSALAAQDGSWSTPFQYWGSVGSPAGIFAGDRENLYLLDSGTGAEKGRWSWEELGVADPERVPWFTGDVYSTTQWRDGRLYLGSWGEDYDAHLLDPETGEVTTLTDRAWAERVDAAFQNRDEDWWTVQVDGGGTVTVSQGGTARYAFPTPLPGDTLPYALEGRVLFQDYAGGSFAVTTLEGELVLPAQKGALSTLEIDGSWYLAVQTEEDGDWRLYDWDGNPGVTLPGGEGSWCAPAGPLVEVLSLDHAAYYRPDTGKCVFRAWFTLEDRTAETEP